MKNHVFNFLQFINESQTVVSTSILKEYDVIEKFPWSEKIEELINEILEKVEMLKSTYNFARHGDYNRGFEFNIKMRTWPDSDRLKKEYNKTEEAINHSWQTFLDDNIQMTGEDIIENSGIFEDYYQAGRSGGWLLLTLDENRVYIDPEDVIFDIVSYLNEYTEDIEPEKYDLWKEIKDEPGFGILQRGGATDLDSQEFESAEEASVTVISDLEKELTELKDAEEELSAINDSIERFWKDAQKNFEIWISGEDE